MSPNNRDGLVILLNIQAALRSCNIAVRQACNAMSIPPLCVVRNGFLVRYSISRQYLHFAALSEKVLPEQSILQRIAQFSRLASFYVSLSITGSSHVGFFYNVANLDT